METLKNYKSRAMLAGILLLAGCSSIQENDTIDDCEGNGLVEATADRASGDYDQSTDPAVLSDLMRDKAEAVKDDDNTGWDITLRNQVIGIGEIVCRGEDDQLYLNSAGVELSSEYSRGD